MELKERVFFQLGSIAFSSQAILRVSIEELISRFSLGTRSRCLRRTHPFDKLLAVVANDCTAAQYQHNPTPGVTACSQLYIPCFGKRILP
jgi:hypothetical protein